MKIKFLSTLIIVFMATNAFVSAGAIIKSNSGDNLQSKQIDESHENIDGEMNPIEMTGFVEWQKLFDSGYDDKGHCIQPTTDGGYIVVGTGYGCKVLLIKIDGNGNIQWEKNFSNNFPDCGWYVLQTDDGGYLVLAETVIFGKHVWLIKTNRYGEKEWERFLGYKLESACRCIQQTHDGGYILAGFTSPLSNFLVCYDTWLLKIDSQGFEEWNKTYERPYYNTAYSVRQTSDDGFIITGLICETVDGYSDLWLIKTDAQGNMEWDRKYGDPSPAEVGTCVQQTTDGGYIVAGETYEPSGNILIKTDDKGNVIWTNSYGGKCVQQTSDGGYIVTGCKNYKFRSWWERTDLQLVKIDMQGKKKWCWIYGGIYNDVGNFVLQTEDGGYVVVGAKAFPMTHPASQSDIWIIKTGEKPTRKIMKNAWFTTLNGTEKLKSNIVIQSAQYIIFKNKGLESLSGILTPETGSKTQYDITAPAAFSNRIVALD